MALADADLIEGHFEGKNSPFKGNLRANEQSTIKKTLQVCEVQKLATTISNITERAGFEPAVGVYTPTTV